MVLLRGEIHIIYHHESAVITVGGTKFYDSEQQLKYSKYSKFAKW
jgi:hypothetical protein